MHEHSISVMRTMRDAVGAKLGTVYRMDIQKVDEDGCYIVNVEYGKRRRRKSGTFRVSPDYKDIVPVTSP